MKKSKIQNPKSLIASQLTFAGYVMAGMSVLGPIGLSLSNNNNAIAKRCCEAQIALELAEEWAEQIAKAPSVPSPRTKIKVDDSDPDSDSETVIASIPHTTAAGLFATKTSLGSLAVGYAEGNYDLRGKARGLYFGHTDPGNLVTNRGFCSWNKAKNLSVRQADANCLGALQRQSAATQRKMIAVGLDPKRYPEALINGTDLWNQSNSAGPQFARKYKEALDKQMKGRKAFIYARVEAFRRKSGNLDASGLFRICRTQSHYTLQLIGIPQMSEEWRWKCIALDQGRRVKAISKVLQARAGSKQ